MDGVKGEIELVDRDAGRQGAGFHKPSAVRQSHDRLFGAWLARRIRAVPIIGKRLSEPHHRPIVLLDVGKPDTERSRRFPPEHSGIYEIRVELGRVQTERVESVANQDVIMPAGKCFSIRPNAGGHRRTKKGGGE